jgi:lysozyme
MSDLSRAINLIRKYEGFNEKAYPDPITGAEPYTIGYGTQFYPDGSAVRRGQFCTMEKALEYLFNEVSIIETQLDKLNLGLDSVMRQALISFIHSIGWEPFLYSHVIDCVENEDFCAATEEMGQWIFDADHHVVGNLLDRRREEINLFLEDLDEHPWPASEILLGAFRNYSASPHEINAIQKLEERISPYILSEFANEFCSGNNQWLDNPTKDYDSVFSS